VISNSEVASHLAELARLTTLDEGSSNAFRVRAYETAVRTIDGLDRAVAEMSKSELVALRGVGSSTADKILELVGSGRIDKLERLRSEYPPDFVELTKIPGIGPKTAVMLRERLGVADVEALRAALDAEKLRGLPGMGEKTESNIRSALERIGASGKDRRTPIKAAMRVAAEVAAALGEVDGVVRAEPMGSLRRFRDTIGDVDVIVASKGDPEAVMSRFVEMPVVREVVGYGARKSAILSAAGMQIDVRVVTPDQYGSAAVYFTGSKAHNIRLRQMAIDRGWLLNEYGLADSETEELIASATEEEVYAALGLPWIPPEIREDTGEIEAAVAGELPALVERKHLRGDLHVHTDLSGDGRAPLTEMLDAAEAAGLQYVAITDHAEDLAINGADRREMLAERKALEKEREERPELTILHGAELNIGPEGTVDYDAEFLTGFDFGVASVHSHFNLDASQQTARVITAMRNPAVNVIGHLTGRKIGSRPGIDLDLEAILDAAEETGCGLEVNGDLARLDVTPDLMRRCRGRDIALVVSSDSHEPRELVNLEYGVRNARRGWVVRKQVANTWTTRQFLKWVGKKRNPA
jgi:DNA polymerase (family 10)